MFVAHAVAVSDLNNIKLAQLYQYQATTSGGLRKRVNFWMNSVVITLWCHH